MLELLKRADGVELVGEAPAKHNFSDALVGQGMSEGWLEFENPRVESTDGYSRNPVATGDAIVLDLSTGQLSYRVDEHPGRYGDEEHHEYRCTLEKPKKGKRG